MTAIFAQSCRKPNGDPMTNDDSPVLHLKVTSERGGFLVQARGAISTYALYKVAIYLLETVLGNTRIMKPSQRSRMERIIVELKEIDWAPAVTRRADN